ncbi:hypothetical protein AgCh_016843 [Apium graveolens]
MWVFVKGVDKDDVVLMAARATRLENQDAIDAAIVTMLADPKQARAGITEIHFLPFNPTDKRTTLTYIDKAGTIFLTWHTTKSKIEKKVHSVIDNFAEHGLRSLGVARQEVPERNKDSSGGPWEFIALLPLFDPPRHDSAETIRRALELGAPEGIHCVSKRFPALKIVTSEIDVALNEEFRVIPGMGEFGDRYFGTDD